MHPSGHYGMEATLPSTPSAMRGDIDATRIPPPSRLFSTTVAAFRAMQQTNGSQMDRGKNTPAPSMPVYNQSMAPTSTLPNQGSIPHIQPITTRTTNRDHKRFVKQFQSSATNITTSPQFTVNKSRPFQQIWNRLSQIRPPPIMPMMTLCGEGGSVTPQDPVVLELERDVSRLLAHAGVRCLGLQTNTNVDSIAQVVERNLTWMHGTPDWFKLMGILATKKVLQIVDPMSSSALVTGSSPLSTMEQGLPFQNARPIHEVCDNQPNTTEHDAEAQQISTPTMAYESETTVAVTEEDPKPSAPEKKRKRSTSKPQIEVGDNPTVSTNTEGSKVKDCSNTETPRKKKGKTTTSPKKTATPTVEVIDVDQEEPVAMPEPVAPPPSPASAEEKEKEEAADTQPIIID